MQKIRVVYFGTPAFSADFLEKLLNDKTLPIEIVGVVTQPDKPVGKKKILTPSPVKIIANKYKIPTIESLKSLGVEQEGHPRSHFVPHRNYEGQSSTDGLALPKLKAKEGEDNAKQALNKIDLALLYAYGKIIPSSVLALPRLGFWNIHPSLLPEFRGPSPTAYPLIVGEDTTGVTLMKMDEKVDHGPIIDQIEYKIKVTDKRPDLEKNLTELGYVLFKKNIDLMGVEKKEYPTARTPGALMGVNSKRDPLNPKIQNENNATFTRLLTRNDGFISLSALKKSMNGELLIYEDLPEILKEYLKKQRDSKHSIHHLKFSIYNLYRGLFPWPGIFTFVIINDSEKRLKINSLHLDNERLVLDRVQLEGKNEVDFATFNRAYSLFSVSR